MIFMSISNFTFASMNESITRSCSRCTKEIQCKVDTIQECACSQIILSTECQEFLKETQYDCLCNDCLVLINDLVLKADSSPTKMTENIHYYQEDGMLVFTELNHIQRGYCCKSNCRHCAYGYKLIN